MKELKSSFLSLCPYLPVNGRMIGDLSDKELVSQVTAGQQNALDQLFRRYYSRLFSYSYQITNDTLASEDIVQELFFQLWVTREKLPEIKSVHAYLKIAIMHHSIDHLRKNKFGKVIPLESIELIENQNLYSELHQYQQDLFIERELSKAIQQSIEALPEQCRMVFKLSRTFGLKNAEIADQLGISVKTVEKHMTKALAHLRNDLKKFLALLPFLFYLD